MIEKHYREVHESKNSLKNMSLQISNRCRFDLQSKQIVIFCKCGDSRCRYQAGFQLRDIRKIESFLNCLTLNQELIYQSRLDQLDELEGRLMDYFRVGENQMKSPSLVIKDFYNSRESFLQGIENQELRRKLIKKFSNQVNKAKRFIFGVGKREPATKAARRRMRLQKQMSKLLRSSIKTEA